MIFLKTEVDFVFRLLGISDDTNFIMFPLVPLWSLTAWSGVMEYHAHTRNSMKNDIICFHLSCVQAERALRLIFTPPWF
jgi:hypothetical protein